MMDTELLQAILQELQNQQSNDLLNSLLLELQTANTHDTYILYGIGVIVGLLIAILFALAWGKNT